MPLLRHHQRVKSVQAGLFPAALPNLRVDGTMVRFGPNLAAFAYCAVRVVVLSCLALALPFSPALDFVVPQHLQRPFLFLHRGEADPDGAAVAFPGV